MELVGFLQQKILEYKKAHPRYSSSQIAKLWGVSTSTLNRIENLETKKPSLEQAIRILKGVGINVETLGEFFPEIKEVFLTNQIDVQSHSSKVFRKNTYLDPVEGR